MVEKEKPKSMLAAKSFAAATGMQEVARWLRVLGRELAERIIDDSERNER